LEEDRRPAGELQPVGADLEVHDRVVRAGRGAVAGGENEHVGAGAAGDLVVAGAAGDGVVAGAAIDRVVTGQRI
jgi:hypothetical protein